ncbi:MAG: alpha/beta hydrolase family protein [Myxococcales bacterium]|nr:alpha/beta hydrolase family protein [Myxococcales bacterium]MCB9578667.1 alpha/beta hydrolase family protein [Polyangiaceae bacterium]
MSLVHTWADQAAMQLLPRIKLYRSGFGDRTRLGRWVDEIAEYDRDVELPELSELLGQRERVHGLLRRRRLRFASPAARRLPRESAFIEAELLSPVRHAPRGACVLLAATGEEGFARRRRFAAPLVRAGIAVLSLENPFYGSRRPRGQIGPVLRTVEEQFAMNLSTVDEARALLAWLQRQGHSRLGVSGYSQGGMMAAFVGALSNAPVACVPRGAGDRARAVFMESALSRSVDWAALARDAGSAAEARAHFDRCLEPVRLSRHVAPLSPRSAIVVAARHDGFVPAAESEALHAHWPGSELRMLESGHVTAALFQAREHRHAIVDAFERLNASS